MIRALTEEAPRLVRRADENELALRLFGGVAIWLRCTEQTRQLLGRDYGDIDLVAHKGGSRRLRELLEHEGYVPERVFNATHGASRLLYHAPDSSYHIDVFLDQFEMSHKLDFSRRLEVESVCLPAAELLLAKLQVAEVNRKDLTDTAMLLLDHRPGEADGPGALNLAEVSEVCAASWGLYTTVTDNLDALRAIVDALGLDAERATLLRDRITEVRGGLEAAPKTGAWKMRARIGRRKRWYEVPEEVTR